MTTTKIVKAEAWPGGPQIDYKIKVDTDAKTVTIHPWWFELITIPAAAYTPKKYEVK